MNMRNSYAIPNCNFYAYKKISERVVQFLKDNVE